MSRFDRGARAIVTAYATPAARAHAAIRWASAPLARIESLLPRGGSVLDVGCGHGVFSLYAALRSSSRVVTGVDIDAAKIELGRRAVERLGVADRVMLTEVTAAWLPPADGFDGVIHAYPLTCMPENICRTVLPHISSRNGIPMLNLCFDEHTSTVGTVTRLEAFMDMLRQARSRPFRGQP